MGPRFVCVPAFAALHNNRRPEPCEGPHSSRAVLPAVGRQPQERRAGAGVSRHRAGVLGASKYASWRKVRRRLGSGRTPERYAPRVRRPHEACIRSANYERQTPPPAVLLRAGGDRHHAREA